MDKESLIDKLSGGTAPTIAVFGDICLDKYLYIDAAKDEPSLETGLTAYQVVKKQPVAGAGGTIINNLRALDAKVLCVGVIGDDGEGYELEKCLAQVGADTSLLTKSGERCTCTYIKPMRCENGREWEMNRQDFKNFTKTPSKVEDALIASLEAAVSQSAAVIVCDQYVEPDCAAVTSRVRGEIARIAGEHPEVIFYADSRAYIDRFRGCIIKCNDKEILRVCGMKGEAAGEDTIKRLASDLYQKLGKTVYVTMGELGMIVCDSRQAVHVPAFPVRGKLDIVGAGDACNAGIVFALTKGADAVEAGLTGNAASNIAIHQIGTTGMAKLQDIIALIRGKDVHEDQTGYPGL